MHSSVLDFLLNPKFFLFPKIFSLLKPKLFHHTLVFLFISQINSPCRGGKSGLGLLSVNLDILEFLEQVVLLLIAAWDGVVDGEDVLRIDNLLDLVLPVDGDVWQSSRDKLLPDLANSVVMGDAATAVHDLISSCVLNNLIVVDNLVVVDSLMGN